MLSKEIHNTLVRTASKKTIKAKIEYLKNYAEDPEMVEVIKLAHSPFVTFGIGKSGITAVLETLGRQVGSSNFSDETWELLEQLANRHLTGNLAQGAICEEMEELNRESQDLLAMILQKDLATGLQASSYNKMVPGKKLVPEYKVALAHKFADRADKVTYPTAVEVKLDGMRIIAEATFDEDAATFSHIQFRSREGLAIDSLDYLKPCVAELASQLADKNTALYEEGVFIDGEVVVDDNFKSTISQLKKSDHAVTHPVYTVFWAQSLEGFRKGVKSGMTYIKMRQLFNSLKASSGLSFTPHQNVHAKLNINPSYMVNSEAEVHKIYANARERNLEGVIVKPLNGQYEYKRTASWLKMKDKQTLDLVVTGFEEGTGKYVNMLGKLIVDYKGKAVKVGSGLTDDQRSEIWDDPESYLDEIIEVSFHEVTPDGSLRHPVFEGFRIDKSTPDGQEQDDAGK